MLLPSFTALACESHAAVVEKAENQSTQPSCHDAEDYSQSSNDEKPCPFCTSGLCFEELPEATLIGTYFIHIFDFENVYSSPAFLKALNQPLKAYIRGPPHRLQNLFKNAHGLFKASLDRWQAFFSVFLN